MDHGIDPLYHTVRPAMHAVRKARDIRKEHARSLHEDTYGSAKRVELHRKAAELSASNLVVLGNSLEADYVSALAKSYRSEGPTLGEGTVNIMVDVLSQLGNLRAGDDYQRRMAVDLGRTPSIRTHLFDYQGARGVIEHRRGTVRNGVDKLFRLIQDTPEGAYLNKFLTEQACLQPLDVMEAPLYIEVDELGLKEETKAALPRSVVFLGQLLQISRGELLEKTQSGDAVADIESVLGPLDLEVGMGLPPNSKFEKPRYLSQQFLN